MIIKKFDLLRLGYYIILSSYTDLFWKKKKKKIFKFFRHYSEENNFCSYERKKHFSKSGKYNNANSQQGLDSNCTLHSMSYISMMSKSLLLR